MLLGQELSDQHAAAITNINLGAGANSLQVEEAWPEQGNLLINLGDDRDFVRFGPRLADIRTTVVVDGGPPEDGDRIEFRDSAAVDTQSTRSLERPLDRHNAHRLRHDRNGVCRVPQFRRDHGRCVDRGDRL